MRRTANVGYSSETSRRVVLGRGHTDDRYGEETVTRRHGRDRQQSLQSRRLPWTADGRQRVVSRRTVDMVVQPKDGLQGLSKIPTRHCQVSKQLRHVHQMVCDQMADIPLSLPLSIDRQQSG